MQNLQKYLEQLRKELQRGEDYDLEALQMLEGLRQQLDQVDTPDSAHLGALLQSIKRLESRFASEHPGLESALRELADALAKMGV